jgi:hypothetical protein
VTLAGSTQLARGQGTSHRDDKAGHREQDQFRCAVHIEHRRVQAVVLACETGLISATPPEPG